MGLGVEYAEVYDKGGMAERKIEGEGMKGRREREHTGSRREGLEEGRGNEIAKRYWKEMRSRSRKGKELSKWKLERKEYFGERSKGGGDEREKSGFWADN